MTKLVFRMQCKFDGREDRPHAVTKPICYSTKDKQLHVKLNKRQLAKAIRKIDVNNNFAIFGWNCLWVYACDSYRTYEVQLVEATPDKRIYRVMPSRFDGELPN